MASDATPERLELGAERSERPETSTSKPNRPASIEKGGLENWVREHQAATLGIAIGATVLIALYMRSRNNTSTSSSSTPATSVTPPEIIEPASVGSAGSGFSNYGPSPVLPDGYGSTSAGPGTGGSTNPVTQPYPTWQTSPFEPSSQPTQQSSPAPSVISPAASSNPYASENFYGSGYVPANPMTPVQSLAGSTYSYIRSPSAAAQISASGGTLFYQPAPGVFEAWKSGSLAPGTPLFVKAG